jgi:hypothetical protein
MQKKFFCKKSSAKLKKKLTETIFGVVLLPLPHFVTPRNS